MDLERVRAALEEMVPAVAEPETTRKSGLDKLRDALKSIAGSEPAVARTLDAALDEAVQWQQEKDTRPVPHTGDRGVLRDLAGTRPRIEVTADDDALFALAAAFRARDHVGYRDLLARGDFFLVPAGTRAKLLLPSTGDDAPAAGWRVRILDGEHEGRSGWVRATDFERTDSDDDPFPPALSSEA
jgi:hypothetical protein